MLSLFALLSLRLCTGQPTATCDDELKVWADHNTANPGYFACYQTCPADDCYGNNECANEDTCPNSDGMDRSVDPEDTPAIDVTGFNSVYPGEYYVQHIADHNLGRHLGFIKCPGPRVCPAAMIGNGYCDDCFGCDQYMVATGFYGDCSKCAYFWSGGAVNVGEFDGGDCDKDDQHWTFPAAYMESVFDECIETGGFRPDDTTIESMQYYQKRNTIILELNKGGWGEVDVLQAKTDIQLTSMCVYANLEQCLRVNGWWDEFMTGFASSPDGVAGNSPTVDDMKFQCAERIEDYTTYQSIDLAYMEQADLLEQCVVAGLHHKIVHYGWATEDDLDGKTSDFKRNLIIQRLHNSGYGTVDQLQTLSNAQIRVLMGLPHVSSSLGAR